jgi:Putative MetA-pathway of phenol degradation
MHPHHFTPTTHTRLVASVIGSAVLALTAPAARAGSLADIFTSGELAGLEMGPIGPALANTVASTYPVASASSSITYTFNPKTETFERRTLVLGPIIGERAETIGKGQLDFGVSLSFVDFSTINGDSLGDLVNQPSINGRVVSFPVPGGVTLKDGRFTNFLPVEVHANIDVQATIGTPSITYGVTPDFDVNLSLPLLATYLKVAVNETVPDPRLPQFMLPDCGGPDGPPCDPNDIRPTTLNTQAADRAVGFGDLLLRLKYIILRDRPVDLAAGLGVSFPSGNPDNFQGTGTYQVQPQLIVSKTIAERFQPLLNLGVNINADDVDRSSFRWAVGGTGLLYGPLTAAAVFLGTNEFNAQTDPIESPFFFQINRNDYYNFSFGLRCLFAETGVVSANVIVPLNDDGLRADYIPTLGVEYTFTTPWSM